MPTIRWNVDANGDWADAADWDLGRLPASGDDVEIDTADPHTINHRTGTDTIHTLAVGNDHFVVSGGSLKITSTASFVHLLTVSGGTLELDGAATVGRFNQGAGTVSGTGTLAFGAGMQAFGSGAILTIARWSLSGGAVTSVNGILSYGGAFTQDAGSTVTIAAADKLRLTGAATLAGSVAGAGTLTFAGGAQAVEAGADFAVANWVISNAAATALDTTLSYAGAFVQAAATTVTITAGDKLRLTGAARLAGTMAGAGTLTFAGGTQAVNGGANFTAANWVLSNGAATTLNTNLTYTGGFIQAAGTTLTLAAGHGLTLTGAATFAGAISGTGRLIFDGGFYTFNPGATLDISAWSIHGSTVQVNEDLTYAGAVSMSRDAVLSIAQGDTLTLTGAVALAFRNRAPGLRTGTLALADATLSHDVVIGGGSTLSDIGVMDETDEVVIGDRHQMAGTATLSIAAGAVYRLDTGDGIFARGRTSLRKPDIINDGLLIRAAGAGGSSIFATILDNGTIEAAVGYLSLRAVTGAGAMVIDSGASLSVGIARSGLGLTFNGGDATLDLGPGAKFAATISGFAPTDTIYLVGRAADAATLEPGDRLVVTNGAATVATFQLAGDYSAATFNVASDGRGGTLLTVSLPGAPPAAPFIAAMAGLGADSRGPAPAWAPSHADAWRPLLSTPRSTHFA